MITISQSTFWWGMALILGSVSFCVVLSVSASSYYMAGRRKFQKVRELWNKSRELAEESKRLDEESKERLRKAVALHAKTDRNLKETQDLLTVIRMNSNTTA